MTVGNAIIVLPFFLQRCPIAFLQARNVDHRSKTDLLFDQSPSEVAPAKG